MSRASRDVDYFNSRGGRPQFSIADDVGSNYMYTGGLGSPRSQAMSRQGGVRGGGSAHMDQFLVGLGKSGEGFRGSNESAANFARRDPN